MPLPAGIAAYVVRTDLRRQPFGLVVRNTGGIGEPTAAAEPGFLRVHGTASTGPHEGNLHGAE